MVMSVPIQYNRSTSLSTKAVYKNNSVSGRPAGWLKKGATGEFFFFFFLIHSCKKKEEKKRTIFFHVGGGGGGELRPPDWLQF